MVRALQAFPITGDERSPIRGDTLRLAVLGYAATGPMLLDEPTGALLFGGNTKANRKRFWEASRVYHHLELTDQKTGRYVTLGHAPADGREVSLGAPFWWRGKGEGHRWSLTGRLLGPRFDSHRGIGRRGGVSIRAESHVGRVGIGARVFPVSGEGEARQDTRPVAPNPAGRGRAGHLYTVARVALAGRRAGAGRCELRIRMGTALSATG